MSDRVARLSLARLNVPLRAPFSIASTNLLRVENVAVRLELRSGSFGIGEAPCLYPVTALQAGDTMKALDRASKELVGISLDLRTWKEDLGNVMDRACPGHEGATIRFALECAALDALARAESIPLWKVFEMEHGQHTCVDISKPLRTCITIPIVAVEEGARLACSYESGGYAALKIKVGRPRCDGQPLDALYSAKEGERAGKIAAAAPGMKVLVDANEAFGSSVSSAIAFLAAFRRHAGRCPWILEQPMHRQESAAMVTLRKQLEDEGVLLATDEGCRTAEDARRVAQRAESQIVNVKLAKSGIRGAFDIIRVAEKYGIRLMLGGMVETRIGMGCAAHLAVGLGCFEVVDLDTPLLMSTDPILQGIPLKKGAYWMGKQGRGMDCNVDVDWIDVPLTC